MHARVVLPGDARSVSAARQFVTQQLVACGVDRDDVADAALLVSELASNALLHARSGIELTVSARDGVIRVSVGDRSRRVPVSRPHSLGAATGRGLMLVESLSSAWGVDQRPTGKSVWFEITPGDRSRALDAWLQLEGEPA